MPETSNPFCKANEEPPPDPEPRVVVAAEPVTIDELFVIVGLHQGGEHVLSLHARDVAGGTGHRYLMPCVGDRDRVGQLWRDTAPIREAGVPLRVLRLSQRTDVTEEFPR